MDYPQTFAEIQQQLQAIARSLNVLQHQMDCLSSETQWKKELDDKVKEIRELNHQLEEQECEMRHLRKQLKDR